MKKGKIAIEYLALIVIALLALVVLLLFATNIREKIIEGVKHFFLGVGGRG